MTTTRIDRRCTPCQRRTDEGQGPCRMHDHGLSARQVCQAAEVTYRQLDYWARTHLIEPSILDASGSGSARQYNEADLRIVVGIKRLLDLGLSLQRIRHSLGYMRDPEGCRWLVIGTRGTAVVDDDATNLAEMVIELSPAVVLDLDDLSPYLAFDSAPPPASVGDGVASSRPDMTGSMAGPIGKEGNDTREGALTREEVMRARSAS